MALINHLVCCRPSKRFVCEHLLSSAYAKCACSHDSIVRLCGARECLHSGRKLVQTHSQFKRFCIHEWKFIFVSSPKVLGCNAPADLLEAKALQEVSDANDSDCVGSRFSNHLSPDLRYFAFYKRISSERSHDVVAFFAGTWKISKVVERKPVFYVQRERYSRCFFQYSSHKKITFSYEKMIFLYLRSCKNIKFPSRIKFSLPRLTFFR